MVLIVIAIIVMIFMFSRIPKSTVNEEPQIAAVDTAKYEEIRYVNAKHFTSSGLYNLHCKLCHGNDGTGAGVIARYHVNDYCPHDLSQITKTDEEVYFVIIKGTEHMPDTSKRVSEHVLTNDDVWMVVYYIKKFKE
jgi:cytochrome c5